MMVGELHSRVAVHGCTSHARAGRPGRRVCDDCGLYPALGATGDHPGLSAAFVLFHSGDPPVAAISALALINIA